MNEQLAKVYLHGPLGVEFGECHQFAVSTPAEAVRALDANYPGFMAAFAKHERYAIYADGDWRDDEATAVLPFSRELHLCPVIEGRAFVGAMLVGALFPALTGTVAATIIGGVLMAGLMVGLSFLLAPKIPKQKNEDTKNQNYAFTGPENVTGQGVAVPLIYGRVHAGSVVVSAGLELGTDLAPTSPNPPTSPPPSTSVPSGTTPPFGGWPPLIVKNGITQPQGWVYIAATTTSKYNPATGHDMWVKTYESWQNPFQRTYHWSANRGFYVGPAVEIPNDDDWREYERGGHD